jgi:O-antigen ligase
MLLIIPAVPFGSLWQINLGPMSVGLTELLVALALASWLGRWIVRREKLASGRPALLIPLLAFLGICLLSLSQATSLEHGLKEVIKWVEVLGVYLIVRHEACGSGQWRRYLVLAVLATGVAVAFHGIYQFLFQVGPESFVLFGRYMRAHGTFEQPNPFAGYLGLTLPVALSLALAFLVQPSRRQSIRLPGAWFLVAVAAGSVMLLAVVMSWSRGAWLGAAAAGIVMLGAALMRRSPRSLSLVAVVLLGVILVVALGGLAAIPPSILQRFSDFLPYLSLSEVRGVEITDANFAVLERMAHWQSAVAMWTDHPWLGVGIGNYAVAYPAYALPLWPFALGHAHNYYLNLAAETGTLGLAVYIALWLAVLRAVWQAVKVSSGWDWGVAVGILGVVVHLTVHNLFDNLFVHGMYLHVAVLLGVASSNVRHLQLA